MTYIRSSSMQASRSQTVDLPFCFFVIALAFVDKYFVWVALCFFIVLRILLKRPIENLTRLPGHAIYAILFFQCSIIGFFELAQGHATAWPFFRDIISFSLIPLYWITAQYFLLRFASHKVDFLYNFVVACAVVSGIKLFGIFADLVSGDISFDRTDEWLISIGSFLIICYNKKIFGKKRKTSFFISVLILLEFTLGFSRTSIIILAILLLSRILLYPKILMKMIILVFGAGAVASIGFSNQFQQMIDKFVRSFTEVSSSDIWTSNQITWNWRGFEIYCAKTKFQNGYMPNKIFGWGFGAEIDAFGFSRLVTGEGALPYLHNGYYTMLIKGGALGLILLFLFYITLIFYVLKKVSDVSDSLLPIALIVAMLVTSYVIGGLFVSANFYWMVFFAWLCKRKAIK